MKYEEKCNRTELTNEQYTAMLERMGNDEIAALCLALQTSNVLGAFQDQLKKRLIYGAELDLFGEADLMFGCLGRLCEIYVRIWSEKLPPAPEVLERLQSLKLRRLIHGILGTATEAAELQEALLHHVMEGWSLDAIEANIREEVGDSQWYHACIANALGFTFEDVQRENLAKLRVRYPDNFDEAAALERRDKAKGNEALAGMNPDDELDVYAEGDPAPTIEDR